MSTTVVPERAARATSRNWIIAGTVGVALAAAGFGAHWWRTGRFIESTDDAYVRADVVTVSPRVAGYVARVAVDDNQPVRRGDVLATLDDRDYRAKVERAQAALDAAVATRDAERAAAATLDAQLGQQRGVIEQARATSVAAQAEATRRDADARRYRALHDEDAASAQRWEQARADALKARADLARTQAALRVQGDEQTVLRKRRAQRTAAIAQADAQLASARAALTLARLDLEYTVIRAVRDGVVGQRTVRPGQYVETGLPLLALVPLGEVYVVANFKETQLAGMRVGQPVEVEVDTYAGHALRGTVASLSPGSGAEFALLPPDNATGNFTKIVQRIPVKIRLEPAAGGLGLRAGMSVTARVDTRAATAGGGA
jgi:membrane fusion protein, multidrug efflux system